MNIKAFFASKTTKAVIAIGVAVAVLSGIGVGLQKAHVPEKVGQVIEQGYDKAKSAFDSDDAEGKGEEVVPPNSATTPHDEASTTVTPPASKPSTPVKM